MNNTPRIRTKEPLPSFQTLHERHIGLYEPLCRAYADAAGVCFSRHHQSPTDIKINKQIEICRREVRWEKPDNRTARSWANDDDATRDAAYSVSLAVIEAEFGLFAFTRAETKTGADYYIGSPNASDLEDAFRLEVSGTDYGNLSAIRSRLREKVEQLRRGNSSKPGIAAVIGFREKYASVEKVFDS